MIPKIKLLKLNRVFPFRSSTHFWLVSRGSVDLYYAKRDPSTNDIVEKEFLFTAQKGDILFSINTNAAQLIELVGQSEECKLLEIDKTLLTNFSSAELTRKLNAWVLNLSTIYSYEQTPRLFTDLAPSPELTIKKRDYCFPSQGAVWCNLLKGNLHCFKEAFELSDDEKSKRILVPVTPTFWLKSISNRSKIRVISTEEIIEDEITLMLSIQNMHSVAYTIIENQLIRQESLEKEKIYEKINLDDTNLDYGIKKLTSIVNKKSQYTYKGDTKNTLFNACQIIGNTVGYDFILPNNISNATNTTNLEIIAQNSNVRVRKVILRGEWWKNENGHLIVFDKKSGQPLALLQDSPDVYHLVNPQDGFVTKVDADIAKNIEPIAYMFLYAFDNPKMSIRDLWSFGIKGLKKEASFIALAALLGSLLALLTPILSGILFDDIIPSADRSFLFEIIGIMLVVAVVSTSLQLIRGILLLRVETKSNINVQAGLMDHLLRLPVSFFKKYSAGDLTMRALGINSLRQILSNTVLTALLSGVFSIVNLGLLFYYSPTLAWFAILLSLVAIGVITAIGLSKLKYDRQLSDLQGDLQGFLFEFINGISKIRISGSEKRIFSLWATKFSKYKNTSFNSGSYQNYVEVFNGFYPLFTYMFFFGCIFYNYNNSQTATEQLISVGAFMAFISAFRQFLNDCLNISLSIISSLNMIPIYERLKPILDTAPESNYNSGDPGVLSGAIEFNHVSFRYEKDQDLVLRDISFKISPGEMVAFVGPSGSGKSTILRLLLGFETPEKGSIYYDGLSFDGLNKDLVRKQTGVVLQDGALMAGSIYKNIVGNSELTLDEAIEASNMAGLQEDIKHMPMGMHTVISEGAATFSGGQKQRLMIARAIVHKPRLIFMDEATSALDNRTQKIVSESLDKLQSSRIVIAHRLSTIINADRIFVMDKGRIVETGTYEELINKEGLFAGLAKRQIA